MGRANDAGEGERGRAEPVVGSYEDQQPERALTFMQHDFGLDRRLMKAVAKMGFVYPTLVQSKCIPLALRGKDLLVSFLFCFYYFSLFVCYFPPHWFTSLFFVISLFCFLLFSSSFFSFFFSSFLTSIFLFVLQLHLVCWIVPYFCLHHCYPKVPSVDHGMPRFCNKSKTWD